MIQQHFENLSVLSTNSWRTVNCFVLQQCEIRSSNLLECFTPKTKNFVNRTGNSLLCLIIIHWTHSSRLTRHTGVADWTDVSHSILWDTTLRKYELLPRRLPCYGDWQFSVFSARFDRSRISFVRRSRVQARSALRTRSRVERRRPDKEVQAWTYDHLGEIFYAFLNKCYNFCNMS